KARGLALLCRVRSAGRCCLATASNGCATRRAPFAVSSPHGWIVRALHLIAVRARFVLLILRDGDGRAVAGRRRRPNSTRPSALSSTTRTIGARWLEGC